MRTDDYERYLTAANDRDWAVVAEHVSHQVQVNGRLIDRATYVSDLSRLAADHPDHHWQIADMLVDGDRLAVRLTTTRSTGQGFELALYRWADRQIADVWTIGTGPLSGR